MKFALRSLGFFAVLVPVSGLSAGCEVKDCETDDGKAATCLESRTRYADPQYNQQIDVDYVVGKHLTIDGIYGEILVQQGPAGKVTATFAPFNYQSHEDEAQAYDEIRNNIQMVAMADANGDVQITTDRDISRDLGAEITVLIPPEFSGTLKVNNQSDGSINPGNILIDSVGGATALLVSTRKLGACRIQAAPSVISSNVVCDGEIELRNVSDDVTAQSTSEFDDDDVIVRIDGISATATGGAITADAGNIQVNFPNTGNFVIDADTAGVGTVAPGMTPATCTLSEGTGAADVSCGTGGPVYSLQAGHEEDYAGVIVIEYPPGG